LLATNHNQAMEAWSSRFSPWRTTWHPQGKCTLPRAYW